MTMDDIYSQGLIVFQTSQALIKAFNSAFLEADINLPHSQYLVLRTVYYNDGLSQMEIANALGKDAAAVKRTIDNLVKKGLIERRQVRVLKYAICITEKGRQLIPRLLEITSAILDNAYGDLTYAERKSLLSYLNVIYKNLEGC